MWKYKCRNQFFMLLTGFVAGFLMAVAFNTSEMVQELFADTLPEQVLVTLKANPMLINVSAGLGFAGLTNIFLLGNLVSNYYPGSVFLFMLAVIMIPEYAMMIGILLVPVSLVVTLYGWISLRHSISKQLKAAGVSGDQEIVAKILEKESLDPKYQQLGLETRKTVNRVNIAYFLGLVAIFCVMFFLENLFVVLILLFVCIGAFQYLARIRSTCFSTISSLLVNDCNPRACLSALLYYAKHGSKYRLKNRALLAQSLIYLDMPKLASDVLIEFPRSNQNNILAYCSLMGNIDYMLKDEAGLQECKDQIAKARPQMGAMGMMIKSEELASVENRIRLIKGDFNTCKKYFLRVAQATGSNLQKTECYYYIALISFVQEDYVVAKMYFEKTIQIGNQTYFVNNAKSYLSKIDTVPEIETDDYYA